MAVPNHIVVAVIADTHVRRGKRRLPEACLARLLEAQLILHAGDLTAAGFLAELESLGPPVRAVSGNVDELSLRLMLPERQVVRVGHVKVGMLHDAGPAAGREKRLIDGFPECAAIVYGHTHLPQVDYRGGVWILNPGSPTERRRAAARSMIELVVTGRDLVPQLITLE